MRRGRAARTTRGNGTRGWGGDGVLGEEDVVAAGAGFDGDLVPECAGAGAWGAGRGQGEEIGGDQGPGQCRFGGGEFGLEGLGAVHEGGAETAETLVGHPHG